MPSALIGTDLGDWLRMHAIDTVSIAGYMTQMCNESTARQAAHEGWTVELLHDASGTVSFGSHMGIAEAETIHKTSCTIMQSAFAAVMSTSEWIDLVGAGKPSSYETNLYLSYQEAHASTV